MNWEQIEEAVVVFAVACAAIVLGWTVAMMVLL